MSHGKADKTGRQGESAAVRVLLGDSVIGDQRWAVKAYFFSSISFTRRFSRPSTGVPTVTTSEPSGRLAEGQPELDARHGPDQRLVDVLVDLMKCVWPRMKLVSSGFSIFTVMSCIFISFSRLAGPFVQEPPHEAGDPVAVFLQGEVAGVVRI
ncbi:MAG TPA: hypothetical protein VFE62_02285 [Gemmataceae bacterium]|nr:hypothetical protein [Gemmataceae bacterium]